MKSSAAATASDVAKAAGVDRSTVSRILNRAFDDHRYAPRTIRAVEKAARELRYRPSNTALALRTGRTMLVGLVVADIANEFFGQLTAAIESALGTHGYRLMIGSTTEDPATQARHLDEMLHRKVDGLILCPAGSSGLKKTGDAGTPVVLIDRPLSRSALPFVGLDNHDAGRQLGEHLRGLGYRTVGLVLPAGGDDPTLRWRVRGLEAGLGEGGRIAWRHEVALRPDASDRQALAERLITTSAEPVEALVGLTNDSTVTAMRALRDVGWRVPERVGLAGIDDFRAAELLDPPLTVVAQPITAIAQTACDTLLDAMSGRAASGAESGAESVKHQDCLLPPQLVRRESLRRLTPTEESRP